MFDKFVAKRKRENTVTKLLTLAASPSRLCVYSVKLKFNICHINLMELSLNSHGKKNTEREMGKTSVSVCALWFLL